MEASIKAIGSWTCRMEMENCSTAEIVLSKDSSSMASLSKEIAYSRRKLRITSPSTLSLFSINTQVQ